MRERLPVAALVVAIVASYLILGAIGNVEAHRNVRVLPVLDPLIQAVNGSCWPLLRWMHAHRWTLAGVFTAGVLAVTVAGLFRAGRAALPLVVLADALVFATWGQFLLLDDQIAPGAALYAAGFLAALVLGIWRPLRRIPGFAPTPGASVLSPQSSVLSLPRECAILFALVLLALAIRMYAITELAAGYDHETIGAMMWSRTPHGIITFILEGLLTTAPGFVHVPTQFASFQLFGTSIYSMRMAAMVWGIAAIPLLYWLVRRLAGTWPAIFGTVLFVFAPEQIFWARTENTFFAPVAVCALITGHLGLSLVEQPSFRTALAAALWMPFCRYFYIPTLVLFTYPLLVFGHAMVFVKGAWRKAAVVLPTLAAGVALWVFSLSFVFAYVRGTGLRFVHPAIVYGAPAWRKLGETEFQQAGTLDLLLLQVQLITNNLAEVVRGITYNDPAIFSHWFARFLFSMEHQTLLLPPLGVLFVLGIGYLLGQLRDWRAAALLMWIGIGVLPGVMSNEPSGRRMAVIFPAVYAILSLTLAAYHRLIGATARRAATGFTLLLAPIFAGILWYGLGSFFLNQTMPVPVGQQARFAAPLLEESDIVLADLADDRHRMFLAFANMDDFLVEQPCFEYVPSDQWLPGLLRFSCDFDNLAYRLALTDAERSARRESFDPQQVSLLVTHQVGATYDPTPLLKELFPSAEVRQYANEQDPVGFTSLTFPFTDLEALRRPQLLTPLAGLETTTLAGVQLARAKNAAVTSPDQIVVRGGILLSDGGSIHFELDPPCPAATFTVEGTNAAEDRPLAPGVHRFELRLPTLEACQLPLRIQRYSEERRNFVPLEASQLTGPRAAALTVATGEEHP